MSDDRGEPCPVCGLPYVERQHIPENPDPTYPPHTTGTLFVHEWRADPERRGHVTINGCSEWHDAVQTDAWDALVWPESEAQRREDREADLAAREDEEADR